MISDDLLNIISEYLDLGSYESLIPEYPKIFTTLKYKKLQDEYQTYFYEQILTKFNNFNTHFKSLEFKDITIRKYCSLKFYYQIIKNLVYTLEYCNIFSYTGKIDQLDIVDIESSTKEQLKKCQLKGYLMSDINGIYIYDEVIITYNKEILPNSGGLDSRNILQIIKNNSTTINLHISAFNMKTLMDLYFYVRLKGINGSLKNDNYDTIANDLISDYVNNGAVSALNGLFNVFVTETRMNTSKLSIQELDAEYENLLELINFRNSKHERNVRAKIAKFRDVK